MCLTVSPPFYISVCLSTIYHFSYGSDIDPFICKNWVVRPWVCQNEQLQKVDAVWNVKCVRINKQDRRTSSSACSLIDRFESVCWREVFPDAEVGPVQIAVKP